MFAWPMQNSCIKATTSTIKPSITKKTNRQYNLKDTIKAVKASKQTRISQFAMSSKVTMPNKEAVNNLSDSSDNEANTTVKEHVATPYPDKDANYRNRLRNYSYQQGITAAVSTTTTTTTTTNATVPAVSLTQLAGNNIKPVKRGGIGEDTVDEMGSIEDLLPPKFLLKKEDFDKKNNTNKIDAIFESVNKLYNMHAQVLSRTKSLEYAVFDEDDGILPQLQGLAFHAKDSGDKQKLLTQEVIELREELDIAKGLLFKQSKQITELKRKQVDLISRSMSENIMISGIKGDVKKADTKAQIYAFLDEHLEIEPEEDEEIPVAHRIGLPISGSHRPIVFRCPASLRKKIFNNVSKLAGKSFSINQQYPEQIAEQKREIRQTIKDIKKLEEGKEEQDKSTFLIRNGKLYVNGQLKKKNILPPTPDEIFVNDSERKKMNNIKFTASTRKSMKQCEFQAFACSVDKLNDVHLAYKKLFRDFPGADHIAAAYNAEGDDGYQDDAEFGSGFRLLRVLKEAKLYNTAVFVIRYYGGDHLGIQRFQVMKDLAEEAIYKLG